MTPIFQLDLLSMAGFKGFIKKVNDYNGRNNATLLADEGSISETIELKREKRRIVAWKYGVDF